MCREDVEKMFLELDKDFDGKLSWREFIGEETTTERAFKLFDENHDGKISKSVMIRAGNPELVPLLTVFSGIYFAGVPEILSQSQPRSGGCSFRQVRHVWG